MISCTYWLCDIHPLQKPVGGVSIFGNADGKSFLTDSIRSKGESPKVKHSDGGLFNSKDEGGMGEEEEEKDELFTSSSAPSK